MKKLLFGIIITGFFLGFGIYSTFASSVACSTERTLFQMSWGNTIDSFQKAHLETMKQYQDQKDYLEFQIQKKREETQRKYGSGIVADQLEQRTKEESPHLFSQLNILTLNIWSAERFYQDHMSNIEATRKKLTECRKIKAEYNLSLIQSGSTIETKEKLSLIHEAIRYADDRKMKLLILKERQRIMKEKRSKDKE